MSDALYDFACIGGGLAGSSFALLMAQKGYRVAVIEKDEYPRHKVCGEYISMECRPFLQRLGLDLSGMELPQIHRLQVSTPDGRLLEAPLAPGGFGLSRNVLDHSLQKLCMDAGVDWIHGSVKDIEPATHGHTLVFGGRQLYTRYTLGAWGKRSNMDRTLERPFFFNEKGRLDNWVGIKYQARMEINRSLIALHNFRDGYLGISAVEDEKVCICYMMRASNLSQYGGSIEVTEKQVLQRNPHIREIFNRAQMLYTKPLAISQISFREKQRSSGALIMLGDAAGLITPLCGNGMSMAFRSAQMAADTFDPKMKVWGTGYQSVWKKEFSARMRRGRILQQFFGSPALSGMMLFVLKRLPRLRRAVIAGTHGAEF